MNLNKALIVGRATADPELRTTPGGQSVTTMGVATNRVWTDKSGSRQEETEYHTVVLWGKQAEVASQFLRKGSLVLIEGRLRTRSWQDKQGQNRKTTEVICERLQLGPKPQGGGAPPKGREGKEPPSKETHEEIPTIDLEEKEDIKAEDLPF